MAFQIYNKRVALNNVQINDSAVSSNANIPLAKPIDTRISNMPLVQGKQDNTLDELVQVIQLGAKIYGQKKEEQDEAKAYEALTQLQKEQMDFEREYLSTKQGKDALNAHEEFSKFSRDTAERISKDLNVSPRMNSAFMQKASQVELGAFGRGNDYSQGQDILFKNQTIGAMRSLHTNIIAENPNDLPRIAQSMQDLNTALDSFFPGQDHTERKNSWKKEDAGHIINSALAQRDVKTASRLFNELRPELGDSAPKVEIAINQMQESVDNEYKQKVISSLSNKAFADFADDIDGAISYIAKSGASVELQSAILNQYLQMRNFNEGLANLKKKEFEQQVYNEGNILFADKNKTLTEKMEYISEAHIETQPTLIKNLEYAINGFEGITDKQVFAETELKMISGDLTLQNFATYKAANLHYIAEKDWNNLEKKIAADYATAYQGFTEDTFIREMQIKYSDILKDKNISTTQLKQVFTTLQLEAFNLGITEVSKIRDFVLDKASSTVTVDKWNAWEKEVPELLINIYEEDDYEVIVPEKEKEILSIKLKEAGIEVTKKNILVAYKGILRAQGK